MRRRLGRLGLAALFVLGAVLTTGAGCADMEASSSASAPDTLPGAEPIFDVRSVTLDARNPPDSSLLVRLRDLGVTHLTLVSFGWQEAVEEPRVRIDTSDGWYSESHRGIRTLARQADTLGMGVILKPHLWVDGYDEGQDRSEIGFDTDARWRKWEAEYRRFVMVYARLADRIDADGLVLGTELTRSATERPAFWRDLAEETRTVYDGALTYAANWHEAYENIQFWDALGRPTFPSRMSSRRPSARFGKDGVRTGRRWPVSTNGRIVRFCLRRWATGAPPEPRPPPGRGRNGTTELFPTPPSRRVATGPSCRPSGGLRGSRAVSSGSGTLPPRWKGRLPLLHRASPPRPSCAAGFARPPPSRERDCAS